MATHKVGNFRVEVNHTGKNKDGVDEVLIAILTNDDDEPPVGQGRFENRSVTQKTIQDLFPPNAAVTPGDLGAVMTDIRIPPKPTKP